MFAKLCLTGSVNHECFNNSIQLKKNLVLTSIVPNNEVYIWSKSERSKQMVAHKVPQSDTFYHADISHALEQHEMLFEAEL